jgi:hypothetical protein
MILRCHQESERRLEGVVNLAAVEVKREAFVHPREDRQDAIATRCDLDVKKLLVLSAFQAASSE